MIDDVDYLIENAEKDSQIVYVDSSLRDKLYYPTANEYTVTFDQPFKLVYGFDVLDASIPVTMYNVDLYNHTIYYSVIQKNPAALISIDPELYFQEIITVNSFQEIYNRDIETFIAIGDEANLIGYTSAVVSPDPNYVMYIRKVITTEEIVLRKNQSPDEFYFFSINNIQYGIKNTALNLDIITILQKNEFNLKVNQTNVDFIYFEKYEIDLNTYNAIQTSNAHIITIGNYIKSLELGNYDILTIVNDMNDLMNPTLVDVTPTTPVPKKQGKLQFSSAHLILVNAARGELIRSLGFDTNPSTTENGNNYRGWTVGSNFLIYGGVYDTASGTYIIVSPGLISLLGERFVVLRIKELEDHLYGSYAYMSLTPGVGMFKMAAAFGGITNLRFDYTTIIKKDFHPIGKLPRLSIRFETSSGRLYDFKGVNHQLMLNVKFYVPKQKIKFTRSTLNPNYDANLMQYMAGNQRIQNREDSDDEQEFDEDDYKKEYQKQIDKYDYTSESTESNENEIISSDSEEDLDTYMKKTRLRAL